MAASCGASSPANSSPSLFFSANSFADKGEEQQASLDFYSISPWSSCRRRSAVRYSRCTFALDICDAMVSHIIRQWVEVRTPAAIDSVYSSLAARSEGEEVHVVSLVGKNMDRAATSIPCQIGAPPKEEGEEKAAKPASCSLKSINTAYNKHRRQRELEHQQEDDARA